MELPASFSFTKFDLMRAFQRCAVSLNREPDDIFMLTLIVYALRDLGFLNG